MNANVGSVTKRRRLIAFGAAGALVLAGTVAAVAVAGLTGEVLAFVLIALGLVLVTSLVFLEVGLSEDRQRRLERAAAEAREPRAGSRLRRSWRPRRR